MHEARQDQSQLWTVCVDRVSAGPTDYFWIVNKSTAPVADSYSKIGTITRIRATFAGGSGTNFVAEYYDKGHANQRWDGAGSAWNSTAENFMYQPTLNDKRQP